MLFVIVESSGMVEPSMVAEVVAGTTLSVLACLGILFGVYKMCTTQRAVPKKDKPCIA